MATATSTKGLLCLALVVVGLVVFWPVLGNDFINYDDPIYVTDNDDVQRGLGRAGLRWALTTGHASNWHPLTWVSHMSDWQLFGPDPFGHHLTNVLLHLTNTVLLFLLLTRLTGAIGRSLFVAALFAIHPLHVESVAWVAERKDVLSTLFWLLATLAYTRYVRRRSLNAYLLVTLALALGLAAKPMLVTLPFTLLLLDYWPLDRWPEQGKASVRWALVREKLPWFALALASSVVTLLVQQAGDAVRTFDQYSGGVRLANAAVGATTYLWKMIWPLELAVFYPHPGRALALSTAAAAAVLLLLLALAAFRLRRSRPYLAFGIGWYFITLVPVIGLVQVGNQAIADRYTYVPLIGIFVVIAWGSYDLARSIGRSALPWLVAPAAVVILLLGVETRGQLQHWRNSETLFRRALEVTESNAVAHLQLGVALADAKHYDEALEHYAATVRLKPGLIDGYINFGNALKNLGRFAEAHEQYARALALDDDSVDAHYNAGIALAAEGRHDEAIRHYRRALETDPDDEQVHNNLGNTLARQGHLDEAVEHYLTALRLNPTYARAHANLAAAYFMQGKLAEAWSEIDASRRNGFEPPAILVRDLNARMPRSGAAP